MTTTNENRTTFEIPEDLINAIEMSSFERQLPRQGSPIIHKFLMDPDNDNTETDAKEWIEMQQLLWPNVDRVVARLHKVAPVDALPEWHHQPWWMKLTLPWSDGLGAAINEADAWCDKREDAQSS